MLGDGLTRFEISESTASLYNLGMGFSRGRGNSPEGVTRLPINIGYILIRVNTTLFVTQDGEESHTCDVYVSYVPEPPTVASLESSVST